MKRALLSVTDKTGIVEFAQALSERGFEILSTGGTATALRNAGVQVVEVSDITGMPEMLDGRVKTLHPKVHGGLLGDTRLPSHIAAMSEHGITAIQILAVNLYAFEKTVTNDHSFDEAIESIDIGGPAMIRAGAKNHASVSVVVDPEDYSSIIEAIDGGGLPKTNSVLAAKAFRHTAYYDSMVARYLTSLLPQDAQEVPIPLPETLTIGLRRKLALRYGENPHQSAALYIDPLGQPGLAQAEQLWGKEISYNNLLDADAAWELVADLGPGACAIIKHGNPCGAAIGSDLGESYRIARSSDTISAFGGIAAFYGIVDRAAAEAMTEKGNFLEVVIGTSYSDEALDIFQNRSGWGKDVRLLKAPLPPVSSTLNYRSIRGGALVQGSDEEVSNSWRVVTAKVPTKAEDAALRFIWKVAQHVKSNAIVIGTENRLLGVGAGQMNRVQSVRLSLEQAGDHKTGACLASDAFFPFPDSVVTAAAAGISAIVQPGGSKKDEEVIASANDLGIAMVFTGVRHFRH